MIDGLWTVQFRADNQNSGMGVLFITQEKFYGGDASYFWTGNFLEENSKIQGEVAVENYSGSPNSVFGLRQKFRIKLEGRVEVPVMELQGYVVEDPRLKIAIRCDKRVD